MRVLVWQSYGMVRVYMADTPIQFFKIHERLKDAMKGWGKSEEDELKQLYDRMGASTNQIRCENLFKKFVAPHIGTHETFETFEFLDVEDVKTA